MHAAPSIILFSVLSGAGFGCLAFLGLMPEPPQGWLAFWQFSLGFGLAVTGLLASSFHLGNPSRAWRAFSQWRSSWLSREAWAAVVALCLMAIYAAGLIFWGQALPVIGASAALLCLLTVLATSMIYYQIATVPRWNTALTPLSFITTALAQGAIVTDHRSLAVVALLLLGGLQLACWWYGDRRFAKRGHSLETATGLGAFGRLRNFSAPHSGSNYLLKEFAYQVGRRQSAKLRPICLLLMVVLPLLWLAVPGPVGLGLSFGCSLLGALVSRWLFFAEAEHVVTLYYGHNTALAG